MVHDGNYASNNSEKQFDKKSKNIIFVGVIILIFVLLTLISRNYKQKIEMEQYQTAYNKIHQNVPIMYTPVDRMRPLVYELGFLYK